MRSGMLVLTWDKRCKIAIGAAKGLAYLHESTYCSSLYEHYIATRHTMHIYSQVLEKLAPHIQQVSMESNGKGVLIDGVPLPFEAGEVGSSHDDSIVDFIRGNMNLEEAAQIPRRTTRSLASSSAQNLLHL
ncbi:hypothetical protein HN51_004636 [Arachis hypogaea]